MKRLIIVSVLLIVGLFQVGCQKHNADAQDIKLARDLADTFGRTTTNNITEFQSCGMMECVYSVWFTTEEDQDAFNTRILREISSHAMTIGGKSLNFGRNPVNELGHLSVISGTYSVSARMQWQLINSLGQSQGTVSLYPTKDSGAKFAFAGKAVSGNFVIVEIYVNPRKR